VDNKILLKIAVPVGSVSQAQRPSLSPLPTMTDLTAIIKVEKKSATHHDFLSLFTVLGDE